jgi:hypothetical protein
MVNVTNRSYVNVRLGPIKLFLGHPAIALFLYVFGASVKAASPG